MQLVQVPSAFGISQLLLEKLPPENDRVLVAIELNGGNDGLNTLVPLDRFDLLANLRRNILIPEKQLLPLTDSLAFHPAVRGFQELYKEGKLGILQNVGYPEANRSHFRSMDILNSGSPSNKFWDSGWLGRYLDVFHKDYPDAYPNDRYPDPVVVSMGNSVADNCQGKVHNYSYALNDVDHIVTLDESQLHSSSADPLDAVNFINSSVKLSNRYSSRVLKASGSGRNLANYDDGNELAQQLKVVARLISGGLKTKIYVLKLMGFDTHALQTTDDPASGMHAELLRTLADAVYSFQSDLDQLQVSDRVIGMTYTEFGRQIKSNASLGTDHGESSPMFIFGSRTGIDVKGKNPEFGSKVPDQGAVPMEFDFRDVYATLLSDWFSADTSMIEKIFDRKYINLELLKKS
jgi:uncharacterized protein (DUF1501 family)